MALACKVNNLEYVRGILYLKQGLFLSRKKKENFTQEPENFVTLT